MFYSSPGFRCQAMQVAQWLRLSGADSGPAKLQWCIRYYVYISYNICIVYIYILVGGFNHLENIWVGQWEEWHPIYHGKFQTCLKPPTSILIVGPSRLLNNNQYLWRQVPVYIYIWRKHNLHICSYIDYQYTTDNIANYIYILPIY